jgi:hypothetical protein
VPPDTAPDSFQPFDTLNSRIFESPFLSGVEVQAEDPTRNPHREAEIRPAELSAVKSELAGKCLVAKCPDRALNTPLSSPRGVSEGEVPVRGSRRSWAILAAGDRHSSATHSSAYGSAISEIYFALS